MRVECYQSPEAFDILADEWDQVLDPRRSDNLFLQNIWQRLWWKHLHNGDLAITTVRDEEGILRGIGPWFIASEGEQRVVRTIGCTDVTDYMDVITMPGYEKPVLDALLNFMLSDDAPRWDLFSLCNIPETSPTCALLPELARTRGLTASVQKQEVCPVITLPGTYDDYLAMLDKKQRHELRRKRRRAESHATAWYIVGPEHDLEAEIETFLDLMALSTPEKAEFLDSARHRDFFRDMGRALFDSGLLKLLFLTVEGQPAAAMWQFAYRDRMLLYNSGLNPSDFAALSPGIVLLTYSIEDAIQRGMVIYDFLRGDETYKYRMGAADTVINRIVISR